MSDNQDIVERIKYAMKKAGISNAELARRLNTTPQNVSYQLGKENFDSIDFAMGVAHHTGFRIGWILEGEGPEKYDYPEQSIDNDGHIVNEPPTEVLRRIPGQSDEERMDNMSNYDAAHHWRSKYEKLLKEKKVVEHKPIPITVNPSGEENIVFVHQSARAGYLSGYGDPQFVSHLPAFNIPGFNQGTFRMFQVEGDSMYQFGGAGLYDGDIVIASFMEDARDIRDGRVYVVVAEEGVLIKRCINRLRSENRVLICNSDNKNGEYPPIMVKPGEIKEVWEFKAKISRQIPENLDYYKELNDMRARVTLIEHKLKS